MSEVYISMGSNLGRRITNLESAKELIVKSGGLILKNISPYYETEPVGLSDQPYFINAVMCIKTDLSPGEILYKLHAVEQALNRKREIRWGPRTIDLDILLYDNIILKDNMLEIPHPRMHERAFVLEPLCDIAPEVIHPVLQESAQELLKEVKNKSSILK